MGRSVVLVAGTSRFTGLRESARTVPRIVRTPNPARHYVVGASLMVRHFGLPT